MLMMTVKDTVGNEITNEEVKSRIGIDSNVINMMKQRKLQMFGHISRKKEKIIF